MFLFFVYSYFACFMFILYSKNFFFRNRKMAKKQSFLKIEKNGFFHFFFDFCPLLLWALVHFSVRKSCIFDVFWCHFSVLNRGKHSKTWGSDFFDCQNVEKTSMKSIKSSRNSGQKFQKNCQFLIKKNTDSAQKPRDYAKQSII